MYFETKDQAKQEIINALLSKQRKIMLGNVEVFLKPLALDTKIRQEREANLRADAILVLL